ncbi:hypothetical protein AAIB33_15515 [Microbacterium sp. AZCO]|uniref:hypothetical protein n=1 Tax=Microbacterium sp. AZCO TaxID=3142976 RepID=UPI0031F4171A
MAADPGIREEVFWLADGEDRGHVVFLTRADGTADPPPPVAASAELAHRIAALDARSADAALIRAALRASVDSARYWQAPDAEDGVASLPDVRDALFGVAEAVAVGTAWRQPRATEQWAIDWRAPTDTAPLMTDPSAALASWAAEQRADEERAQRERPRDPHANRSGIWWSVPQRLLSTRARIADALELIEDSPGWETATLIPVRGAGRTFEVRSANEWSDLCRTYPMEVTAARRHDWFRLTGRDGRWLIPDWERVAGEWDAVHLTTLGYLSAAMELVPIDDEYASVIAGWAPDSTIWLAGVVREWHGPREAWMRSSGGDEWIRVEDAPGSPRPGDPAVGGRE